MVHELIYTSIETRPMSEETLRDMLDQARIKNRRLKVTGLLFYYKKEFFQILEGDRDTIFDLYETIVRDDRHRGVELFWEADIDKRSFKDWSMGYASDNEAALLQKEGYVNFIRDGISSVNVTEYPTEGRVLMMKLRDILMSGENTEMPTLNEASG